MAVLDGGGGGPTLDPKAKHYERQLFKVFSASTASIWLTQDDWRAAKTQLEDLAKDVRQVHTELQAPPTGGRGWQGPAAEAALASLEKLGSTLDTHATKVGDVDTSLGQVHTAITDAKAAWYSEVASISTYVDPAAHTRLPAPYLPTPENRAQYSVPDTEAAAAAEDALWEQRNQAAKRVLDRLGTDTQTATSTMPIETRTRSETPYSPSGPGGGGGDYPTGTRTPSTSGGYAVHPDTGVVFDGDHGDDDDRDRPDPDVIVIENPDPDPDPELDPDPDPETGSDPETGLDPISSDGDVSGTVGTHPTGGGATSPGMQAPGGGGIGAGGLAAGGLGAGAAGVGGILGARGGMARGGAFGAGSPVGTRGGAAVRPGGAGARGAAFGAAGGARGGATMVPGGGGAAGQSRAGASGRGSAVKGASGSGRYGVPRLDGKGGGVAPTTSGQSGRAGGRGAGGRGVSGRGVAGSPGSAGRGGPVGAAGAGGARKGEKPTAADVDRLIHEDEDTWYDGTDESSPQVWD